MEKNKMISRVENDRILILERIFDAPRSEVFKMFKDPGHLKYWWGPRGWELPVCKVDFKPGGVWHYCMKCVDKNQGKYYGTDAWGKAVYKQIVEPEKIVYTDFFSDADGNINKDLPSTEVTTDFQDLKGKTKLISRSEYVSAQDLKTVMNMGMMEGITQTWDRLEEHLNSLTKGRSFQKAL
ncbi:MAG: ATPase [Oligoflexia bacterium]|nr:MAG: ATPase [Oligoflexia bacterium]